MTHYRAYKLGWFPVVTTTGETTSNFSSEIGLNAVVGREVSISPHTEETLGFNAVIGAYREFVPRGFTSTIGFSDESIEDNFKFQWKYFGTLQNGDCDADGTYNVPTMEDYWVSFDGSNDGLYWDDNLDTSDLELKIVFKLNDTAFVNLSSGYEVVFKSGSSTDGMSISIIKRFDGQPILHVTGALSSVDTNIEINVKNVSFTIGTWYELFVTSSKLLIREYGNESNSFTVNGSIDFGYADYYESIGFSLGSSPVLVTTGGYLNCSIRSIDYYHAGTLDMPADVNLYPFYFCNKYGNNYEGNAGVPGETGSATIEDDWVTFDGNDAWYFSNTTPLVDISDIDIKIIFRLEESHLDVLDGYYTIWSIGDATDGFELGIYDRFFAFVSRNNTTLQENIVNVYNFEMNVWYEAFLSTSKITIRKQAEPSVGFTQYATVDVNANYSSGYHSLACGVGAYIWKGGSGSWADYVQMSVKELALYKKGGLTFPSDLSEPVVGPIYRYNWGSDVGSYYGWTSYGTPTLNTDNVEGSGGQDYHDSTGGRFPKPSTGWGLVVEFEVDTFASAQVFWKTGDEVNGVAIGIDASGNIGVFGRNSSTLTSITVAASTYLSTGTRYLIYANETDIKIYTAALSLVAEATGTLDAADSGGSADYQSVLCAVYGSAITGSSSTYNDFMDGRVYAVEMWEQDDLEMPEANWHHAESEIGFADTINGEITSAVVGISEGIGFNDANDGLNVADTFYTENEIGFNDSVVGTQVATQKEVASTLGLNDQFSVDHIDETSGEVSSEIGFNDTIDGYNSHFHKGQISTLGLNDLVVGRAEVRNKGQQSTLGLSDEAGAYNAVNHVGSISTLGLNDEVGGKNIITRKESASILGLNDSANVNLEQEVSASEQIAFNETVGEISIRNVGFSSELGLEGGVGGGNPFSPDNEGEIGFSDEIGATHYPVKSISEGIGFSDLVGVVSEYEKESASNIGFNVAAYAENVGNLIPYHPVNMRYKFYLTLTGANDGLDDYEITQLKTIQFRMKSGEESSYLGVSAIYSVEKEVAIELRPNGTLILEMESVYEGVTILRETLMEVDLSDVRYDIGSHSQSITMNGYGALTYDQDVSYLVNATFKRVNQDGRISYRFPRPDFYLRPGWSAVYGMEKFIVDEVAFYVGELTFEMDVYFEPETLTGTNDNDIYVRRWFPTYRERKLFVTLTGSADGVDDYSFENVFHLEIRKKAGAASYASVTLVYTKETSDAITARPNGDIRIDVQDGLDASPEELLTVNFNNLSYQFLQKSRTVTIAGFRQVPYTTGVTYTPTNVIAERVEENGDYYIRSATPNINIKPGCTISYGGKTFIAGKVSFNFASQSEWMEVSNTANINVDRYISEILGISDSVVSNTFYRTNHSESEIGIDDCARVSFNDVENAPATAEIGFTDYIGYELNP